MENESNKIKVFNDTKIKPITQEENLEQNKENLNKNIKRFINLEISSSNNQNKEKPKQPKTLQLSSSHQSNTQKSPINSSNQRPKQTFQISSSCQSNTNTEGKQKHKQAFEITKQISPLSNAKGLSISGQDYPKQVLQMSSCHRTEQYKINNGNNKGNIEICINNNSTSKNKLLVVSNSITLDDGQNKKVNYNSNILSSSNGHAISYIAPDKLDNNKSNNEFKLDKGDNKFIKYNGKDYEMIFDNKYKKSEPKDYKIINKVNNLFFKAKRTRIETQQRRPPMSVKTFFFKKGKRRRK